MKPQKSKKAISRIILTVPLTETVGYILFTSNRFPNLKNRFKNIIKSPV